MGTQNNIATVKDLKTTNFAYIFENENFDPILFDPKKLNYRTITLGLRKDGSKAISQVQENQMYAIFPCDKISSFDFYPIFDSFRKQSLLYAYNACDEDFYFAIFEHSSNQLIPVVYLTLKSVEDYLKNMFFSSDLDCILNAYNNSNYYKKLYFKVFHVYQKYLQLLPRDPQQCLQKIKEKIFNYFVHNITRMFVHVFWIVFGYIPLILVYHFQMLLFYILSYPILIFPTCWSFRALLTWIVPSILKISFYGLYLPIYHHSSSQMVLHVEPFLAGGYPREFGDEITAKTPEIKWGILNFLSQKHKTVPTFCRFITMVIQILFNFIVFTALPFSWIYIMSTGEICNE